MKEVIRGAKLAFFIAAHHEECLAIKQHFLQKEKHLAANIRGGNPDRIRRMRMAHKRYLDALYGLLDKYNIIPQPSEWYQWLTSE